MGRPAHLRTHAVMFFLLFFLRDDRDMAAAAIDLVSTDATSRGRMSRSMELLLAAIFLVLWGFLVTSLVDTVVRSMQVRGAEELTTLVVLPGTSGGLAAFGLLGIFIGLVALALAVTLSKVVRRQAGCLMLELDAAEG
ncbi:MAG TPA: hypothetical protein PKL08_17105 [Thermoanaerobaculaceae bacterium]|nr:hypothetical protein [Thermoanaerobaculaceae bacterium]